MSTKPLEFQNFTRLPIELREEIWRLCLPHRVCELDYIIDDILYEPQEEPYPCELFHTTRMNARPPAITRVCQESRRVAFKTGSTLNNYHDPPAEARWSGLDIEERWLDRSRDSMHLNWTSPCNADYDYDAIGHPLRHLVWESAKLPRGMSIMMSYLDSSISADYGTPAGLYPKELFRIADASIHPSKGPYGFPLDPGQLNNLEALMQLPRLCIVMRVLVIHCELGRAAATGLFGLLADARIQIVDMQETALLEEFWGLAEQCERERSDAVKQDLERTTTLSMRHKLDEVVAHRFDVPTLTARWRPAIMFRLCTRMCNQSGYEHSRTYQATRTPRVLPTER